MSDLAPILNPIGRMLAQSEREFCDAPESRCAWCDKETGRVPRRDRLESHTICARHLEQERQKLQIELTKRH